MLEGQRQAGDIQLANKLYFVSQSNVSGFFGSNLPMPSQSPVGALSYSSLVWSIFIRKGLKVPLGALHEHIELEEERLRREQEETYRRNQEEERVRLQQRFLAGADCGWTQIDKSEAFYCRRNGRAFRIARAKDKRWNLYRITIVEDAGVMLGIYQGRREASKALEKIAYQPEPHW